MELNIVAMGVTALIALGITALLGFVFIPMLHKMKYGQTIKEIGPNWHKNKEGTPTMGGIMFIIGIVIATIVGFFMVSAAAEAEFETIGADLRNSDNVRLFAGLGLALAMGLIGFIDDFISVVKKRNKGLSAKQKTLLQFLVIIVYMVTLHFGTNEIETNIIIPFVSGVKVDLWLFYYPIIAIAMYFIINAVNLTDGIDGLCPSVTFFVAIAFMFVYTIGGMAQTQNMQILAIALAAGCLGFLIWNFHPAKVFMGDTGSMFLGGLVVALGMSMRAPMVLLIAGLIYIVEALSVVIQVISFQFTGKRIFKMSPIHHHFEMSGWSENKIVIVFSAITVGAGILTYIGAANSM